MSSLSDQVKKTFNEHSLNILENLSNHEYHEYEKCLNKLHRVIKSEEDFKCTCKCDPDYMPYVRNTLIHDGFYVYNEKMVNNGFLDYSKRLFNIPTAQKKYNTFIVSMYPY